MIYNVSDIANKILAQPTLGDAEGKELISNLKLQKLLYYQQGFHLAFFNEPLFEAEIEAWQYGPVVPEIYALYQSSGSQGIHPYLNVIDLESREEQIFSAVHEVYGQYSAIGLMNLTHGEPPWTSTSTGRGNVITRDLLESFFRTRINNG